MGRLQIVHEHFERCIRMNGSISLGKGYKDFINFIMDFCDSKFKKQKKIREEGEKGES